MLKRVAIMLFCLMMVFIATFGFVVGVVAVPTIYSYAAVDDDSIYVPLRDPSDLVVGFQAYCKSRDLTIEGSLADAVTTFTTGAFNSACNELGINISQLQAELKAEYDQSGKPVKFLFNDTGVMAMNRIFAQFLQDNELEVGDSADATNNTVLSGEYFVDGNGYGCWVYTFASVGSSPNNLIVTGSIYHDTNAQLLSGFISNGRYDKTFNLTNSQTSTITIRKNDYQQPSVYGANNANINIASSVNSQAYEGGLCIFRVNSDPTKLHFGCYKLVSSTTQAVQSFAVINNADATNVRVYLTTNNTVINNNVYEGDTIINNEGDVIVEPDPVPPGGSDPGWDIGGGGGTATDGDGNTWNIQFPDFELPDLNIDWSINGLGEKFPFSIPFDLVALVTVLNAEPQAPRFEGTVNFGFTTWNYDINLQQFDSVAQACRIAELLLLVVGLILVTRSIIKG